MSEAQTTLAVAAAVSTPDQWQKIYQTFPDKYLGETFTSFVAEARKHGLSSSDIIEALKIPLDGDDDAPRFPPEAEPAMRRQNFETIEGGRAKDEDDPDNSPGSTPTGGTSMGNEDFMASMHRDAVVSSGMRGYDGKNGEGNR